MVLPAVVLALTLAFALAATLWFQPVSGGPEEPSAERMDEAVPTREVMNADQPIREAPAAQADAAPAPAAQMFVPPPALPDE
ncbi:MAG: hypothetical protein ACRC2H_11605, partial [Silanimonas sp.]